MNTVLTVLIMLLKIVGVLLLAALAVLLVALLLPMGARVRYAAGALTAEACIGPVRLQVWPRPPENTEPDETPPPKKKKRRATEKAKKQDSGRNTAAAERPAPAGPPPANAPAGQGSSGRKTEGQPQASAPAGQAGPAQRTVPDDVPEATAPAPNRRVQALLGHLREDPLGFLEAMLAHVAFAGGRVLRGIHIRHLTVYWTVTAREQDAAATAIQYGQQIALLNNLLVRARENMDIRADSLYLEPDFTGELAGRRALSCEVTARPITLVALALRLLLRLLREPQLKGVLL